MTNSYTHTNIYMNIDIDNLNQLGFSDQYGFRYRAVTIDLEINEQREQINTLTHNAIFFQLAGELHIYWDNRYTTIKPGELYFLPRGANVSAYVVGKEVKYIVARLDHELYNKSSFSELLKNSNCDNPYSFSPLPIREPLGTFIESMKHYIIDGVDNLQLQNMKFIELYIIFRHYYTDQECRNLFHPVLKKSSTFKTFVLDNYEVSTTIDELAKKANMSRSTFDRKFKDNFGMTPLKWIDIQTRLLILRKASEPNVTVKDIMYEIEVYNSSQFTKLCKRLCGLAPSKLIRQ